MLVKLPPHIAVKAMSDPIYKIFSEGTPIQEIRVGLYEADINFNHVMGKVKDGGVIVSEHPFGWWPDFDMNQDDRFAAYKEYSENPARETEPQDYGVCDYPEQLIEKFPIIETDDRSFIVIFTKMTRDQTNKGKGGGWRWHKWGVYIGDKEPQCEYLDDEPEIESVYVYSIYEVNV